MKLKNIVTTLLAFTLLSTVCFANDANSVATVLLKRGNVKAKLLDGKVIEIKMNQTLPEGAKLITSEKSYVKLIFIDKSTINVGPSSEMLIQAFPKKEAGIIKLIRGQIRAEVTKNYMEMDDKSKSKLYIQTKSAAMGIRGTDFQVNYNPENNNSTLIVFEGKVAMGHIDRANQNAILAQRNLENLVSNNTAVFVKQGQFSAVNLSVSDRPTIPTKLAPKQLDALRDNTTGIEEDSKNKKQLRDPVPPGVDGSAFVNSSPDVIKSEMADAKGFFNNETHEFKPAAGAIIDLKTVNFIAPPEDATFDRATKTFVLAENYGKIDVKSGEFKAPEGFKLSNDGQFKEVAKVDRKERKEEYREEHRDERREEHKEDRNDNAEKKVEVATNNNSSGVKSELKQSESKIVEQKEQKFEPKEQKFEPKEQKFEPKEQKFEQIEQKYEQKEQKFEPKEQKFEPKEQKFEPKEQKFEPKEQKYEQKEQKYEQKNEPAVVAPPSVAPPIVVLPPAVHYDNKKDYDKKDYDKKDYDKKDYDKKDYDKKDYDKKDYDNKGHDNKGHDNKGHDNKGNDNKGHDNKDNDKKGKTINRKK